MKNKYKRIDIKTKKLVKSVFLGNYKAAFKGRGIEFSDFREYSPLDDAKHIDWLVSAREGKTIIRRYKEERELDILFLLDLSDSMQFGFEQKKIDTLIETLYLIAFSGIQNGDKVGALLFGGKKEKFVSFKKGNIALFRILESIENYKGNEFQQKLDLNFLNKLPIKNSLIFILTDRIEVDEKALRMTELKNDLVFINIFDSFENTLSGKKGIFHFGDEKKEIFLDLDNQKKKEKYRKLRNAKIENFKKLLLRNKISHLEIDETTQIYKAFLKFMKSREL